MSLIYSAKRFFSLLVGVLLFSTAFASGHSTNEKEEFNVGEMIMHHIKDAHEWHLWGPAHGEGSQSIYLPIILLDGGLKVFSSAHFYHGTLATAADHKTNESVEYVVGNGPAAGYAMYHEEIYKLHNGELSFEDGHVHGAQSPLDFSITKNVLSLFMGAILILVIMGSVARFYKKNGPVAPRGLAKYLEV